MKKLVSLLLALVLVFAMSSVAMAADYELKIGDGKEFADIATAVASFGTLTADDTVTYILYDDQDLVTVSGKYKPDLAAGAGKVYVKKADTVTDEVRLTLKGVYFGRLAAMGAELNVSGLTLADARNRSGEGTDPDPWEFCYLGVACKNVNFTDCKFEEGIQVSVDATFTRCTFTMMPQYYENDPTDYGVDHYALWVAETGDVVVDDCTFVDVPYGGIKSTWDYYGDEQNLTITVTDSTFENVGVEGEHRILHLDGAKEIEVSDVTVNDCWYGDDVTEDTPAIDKILKNKKPQETTSTVVEDAKIDVPVPPTPKRYAVDVAKTENGDVTVKGSASYDSGVVITAAPHYGYEVGTVTVTKADGTKVDVTERADGTYSFSMPRGEVTIKVTFVPQGEAVKMVLTIGSKAVDVNGVATTNDVAPVIKASRTFLPVRLIAENLGAKVEWNNDAQTVTITKGDTVIVLTVGSTTVLVNGQPAELEAPVFIENSRTYLPVRFIAEKLGADVEWNGATNEVTIIGRK